MEAQTVATTSYDDAIAVLNIVEPDPETKVLKPRLRPSEEAALLVEKYNNPTPPWGKKISLAGSLLGKEKCLVIGRKLLLNSTVTFLDLSMCDMRDAAPEFFRCVARNNTLKHLSVNANYIGDEGAIAAAPSLLRLEELHLCSNQITDKGVDALCDVLRKSETMKTLTLRENQISVHGICKLIGALECVDELYSDSLKAVLAEHIAVGKTDEVADNVNEEVATSNEDNKTDEAPSELDKNNEEKQPEDSQTPKKEAEHPFNTVLYTLWIQGNPGWNNEAQTILNTILAKRVPQPPKLPGKKKSKKAKK
ncbi:hypothetical protein AGDE_13580 [Angomonas deanei]|uniref:Leucine Rich repeat, putative n=1 Tax=Angomonas deanei TaxID=59799 RepID=A0A7G2CI77_9TRYP|nr:hypothetical protein AGDE_13580 [Angomonas deanei]CAD2218393.1 Leucine Rich repeat, putative [Angomonas deanei]|eukprot:EPY22136.1 hypothetical protein AGDE_13580 [Angomonas deanei]